MAKLVPWWSRRATPPGRRGNNSTASLLRRGPCRTYHPNRQAAEGDWRPRAIARWWVVSS
jgi:hypothetical protein